MNTPERLAATYLRLNGFFVSPHFTVFEHGEVREIDFLGLRAPGAREIIEGYECPLDEELFRLLAAVAGKDNVDASLIGAVAEVKGTNRISFPDARKVAYAGALIGDTAVLIGLSFSTAGGLRRTDHGIHVPLGHCLGWVRSRVRDMDTEIQGRNKTESWNLSESFLSHLLWIDRLEQLD